MPYMSPRMFVGAAAAACALIALMLLGAELTTTSRSGSSLSCGSAFSPNVDKLRRDARVNQLRDVMIGEKPSDAELDPVARCETALGDRRLLGWGLFAVGAVALSGAVLVRRRADQPGEA